MNLLKEKFMFFRFSDFRLKVKLVIIFVVFMLLPLLFTNIYFYNQSSNSMINEEYGTVFRTLKLIANHVDLTLQGYESKTVEYYRNEDVFNSILRGGTNNLTESEIVHLDDSLRELCAGNKYMESAYMFLPNKLVSYYDYYGAGKFAKLYYDNKLWESDIKSRHGKVYWIPNVAKSDRINTFYISVGKVVRNIYSELKEEGILVININLSLLSDVCSSIDISKRGVILVTDRDDNILWHGYSSLIGKNIDSYDFIHKIKQGVDYLPNERIDGKQYSVISSISEYNQWKYIALIPKADIQYRLTSLRLNFVLIILLSIILYLLGGFVVGRYITSPINRMIVVMDRIKRGDLKATLEKRSNDEIGVLYNSFNEMNNRIVKLIDEINESRKNEKEQEIKALRAQINPHFLYNTLEAIGWMARNGQVSEVSKMLVVLSQILRYSISRSSEFVTFEEELKWVKNYVFIQKNRFENKFDVEYEIDNEILKYKCFRLLLQPFVENAILHGFSETISGGRIFLKAYEGKKRFIVIICDNGCGMSQEKVEQFRRGSSQGIGLYNIEQQIKLNFGRNSGVSIFSKIGKGTTIVIKLPKVE